MAKLSDLIIKIGADTKELNKGLGDAQRRIQATTGNIQNLGKQMSMGLTLPIVGLGAAALKSAAELQTMETSFISLTGGAEQAAAMMEQLNTFAAKTPFQIEGIASAARQLIASGTPLSEVNNQLQFLGDIAATSGGQIEDIASIFAKVNAKGKVELDNLNQLAERGIPIFKALSDATGLPAESLGAGAVSVEQFNAVLKSFSEEGGFASGAMQRLSETAAGKFSTAMDNLKQAGAAMTESLLPAVGGILDGVTELTQYFTSLSAETKQVILVVGGLVAAVGPMLVILPQLVAGFGMVKVAMLQGVIPAMQKMIAVMAANPILLVTAAVVGLGVHLNSLSKNADIAGRSIQVVQDAIKSSTVEAAKQSVAVDQLSKSVLDESKSEGERLKALQELQRMSPDYFAGLDLEKSKMGLLKQAVDSYKTSLLQAARVKGFQSALEEQAGTMAEMEIELQAMNEKYAESFALIKQNNGIAAGAALTYEDLAAAIAKGGMATQGISSGLIRQTNDYMAAKAAADRLTGAMEAVNNVPPPKTRLEELRGQLDGLMSAFANTEKGTAAYEEIKAAIITTREEIKLLTPVAVVAGETLGGKFKDAGTEVKKAAEEVDDFAETFRRSLVEDLKNTPIELPVKPQLKLEQIDPIEEDTTEFDMDFQEDFDKFQKNQEMMREEWNKTAGMTQQFSEMFGSTIGNIVSGSQTAGQAMKSLALNVVKTLIGIAKAAVIANATQTATAAGPAALPMTPILIAGGLSLVEGLLGAIAFADGGIVSGPTLGLVGEYAGAKNNPEVIAPLDKLKSMIGDSGGGRVAVYGRLQGSDINISGERGKQKLNRTR